MEKKTTLVVVDFQYDFCLLGAPLYVPGSDKALWNISHLIENKKVDRVLQTLTCKASPENDKLQDELTAELGPDVVGKITERHFKSRFKRLVSPIIVPREMYD